MRRSRSLVLAALLVLASLVAPAAAGGSAAMSASAAASDSFGHLERPGLDPGAAARLEAWRTHRDPSHVRTAAGPVPSPVPDPSGGQRAGQMQVVCPKGDLTTLQNTDATDRTIYGCPIRVYDTSNPFGSPQIFVKPDDLNQVAFFSLHGGAVSVTFGGEAGSTPTERSRYSATTFTSSNQGVTWSDQPTGVGGDGYVEAASGAMDNAGNLYVAYTLSIDTGAGNKSFGGRIVLYKAAPVTEFQSVAAAYEDPAELRANSTRHAIPQAFVVHVPPSVPPQQPPMADPAAPADPSDTGAPANPGEASPANQTQAPKEGDFAVPEPVDWSKERVAVVWFERLTGDLAGEAGWHGWIDAAFTTTSSNNTWNRVEPRQRIGPCLDASNPVAYDGNVYVACVVDAGYTHRRGARVGDIDVWRIDPLSGNATMVAKTGLVGGHPLLATTPDGYMAMVTTRRTGDQAGSVRAATGWYGRQWQPLGLDLGLTLHALAGNKEQRDLSVNALAIAQDSRDVVLLYKEWQRTGNGVPAADPNNPPQPGQVQPRLTDFVKVAYAFNECNAQVGALGLVLGTGLDAYNVQAYQESPGTFNDMSDGLQAVRDLNGQELFAFAVNDYGAMQYGYIVDPVATQPCFVLPPIPPPPVPPIPQALTVANPASLLVGSVVGVVAIAMVSYLLTVKRRVAQFAVAEDK